MREQERANRPSRPGLNDDLASRLDALSPSEADRVLERAIRMQSQKHSSEQFTADQIRRIASELGVDSSVVDRALREEAAKPAGEGSWWLVPSRLVDRVVAKGTEPAVTEQVMGWMEAEEGLRAVEPVEGGLRWQPDKHWTTSTRLAFGSDGTKALRGMPEVVHRQRTLGSDEQLVELEVGTSRIRATAWGVGGGIAGAGVLAGVANAVLGGGGDLLEFAAVAVPGAVLATSTLVITAKAWTASIKRGMTVALNGIAHPELHRRSARRRRRRDYGGRSGFARLVDDVSAVLDDIFD